MSRTPLVLLDGTRVSLAMPSRDHLEEYHRWENDPGTILGFGTQVAQSWEVRAGGWEAQGRNRNYPQFEVIGTTDHTPLGLTTLQIDPAVRTAEFVILLAPEARGKGLATEATALTLRWAFQYAALRTVWLKVLEPNVAGVAAYQKAGFKPAGRLRQSGFWLGRLCDELLMDATAEDNLLMPWTGV
ncbi:MULTISPECIES: GNAT family protein [Kitasatospora]|uniref:Putative acetyltransferase n=1 Tax=Kitasatospora setae (strain ATCC 33774 / DSM 43861 / JCM 3304 / KCC A-0304 / NBRC 14216 / KM-6054) TaxID=452652 RepID=E4NEY8_KITSK|nr:MULTISPECIES: GNAT family protein [Kitasatospora]BAJ29924.1 putative acetyltransferase [Kitasatospora setae KM-6054]